MGATKANSGAILDVGRGGGRMHGYGKKLPRSERANLPHYDRTGRVQRPKPPSARQALQEHTRPRRRGKR